MAGDGSEREFLAQWEQRLRLVRETAPDGTQQFVVEVLDEGGDVVEASFYSNDDFPRATDDYGSRNAQVLDTSPGSAA